MDSLSQHHQKEVNYGRDVTKSEKALSNVRLISLCYGKHLVLRLGGTGLLLSTSGLIVWKCEMLLVRTEHGVLSSSRARTRPKESLILNLQD